MPEVVGPTGAKGGEASAAAAADFKAALAALTERARPRSDEEILATYPAEDAARIKHRQHVLNSLGYHIGQKTATQVHLSEPGQRKWYHDPNTEHIFADPEELLHGSEYLVDVSIAHEGGHARITRHNGIPDEIMHAPGFSNLWNAIEDTRDNNFIVDGYPVLTENIQEVYEKELGFGRQTSEEAIRQLGQRPRFMQAGSEFIIQWIRDRQELEPELSEHLDPRVREVVERHLDTARRISWTYPTKDEANDEDLVQQYAEFTNGLIVNEIWPDMLPLIELDRRDQSIINFLDRAAAESIQTGQPMPPVPEFSEEESGLFSAIVQHALGQAVVGDDGQPAWPHADITSLPEELRDRLYEYIKSHQSTELSDQQLFDFLKKLAELHEGIEGGAFQQATDAPDEPPEPGSSGDNPSGTPPGAVPPGAPPDATPPAPRPTAEPKTEPDPEQEALLESIRNSVNELERKSSPYQRARTEMRSVSEELGNELESIFTARRSRRLRTGFRTGSRYNVRRRIHEKGRGEPASETTAYERRDKPTEKDYAFTILVDLSGSMRTGVEGAPGPDGKPSVSSRIQETFKAVVALSEVFERIGIRFEVLGFNEKLHLYKPFDGTLDASVEAGMGKMVKEVDHPERALFNDDGWALGQASQRLAKESASEQYLIVLSDGEPWPSDAHSGSRYDLKRVASAIESTTNQVLIGTGIQSEDVRKYYRNAIVENDVPALARGLAELIRDIVTNPDKYRNIG
ncbi:MAG TPA: hypothetical protein VLF67_01990 [Candidatus Saccharimonas sp.]|nr:hypothetical protein [Candidatus Saccharimonas sp.]